MYINVACQNLYTSICTVIAIEIGHLSSQTRVCDIWWHYSRPVGSVGQYLVTEELTPDSSRWWHHLFFLPMGGG